METDPRAATVYCLPYAGGNAYAYRPLETHLPTGIRLVGIELPGRGQRAREPLCRSLEALADDAFARLRPRLHDGRYALFGHSMGASLCFLCLRRIVAAGLPLPAAVFLSGARPPAHPDREKGRYLLSRGGFVDMLRTLGGCPPEVLAEEALIDYFEPILRADFEAIETWRPAQAAPLPVPFVVLHGQGDSFGQAEVSGWARETALACRFHEFPGGHFFILRHWPEIACLIGDTLRAGVDPAAEREVETAWQGSAR